MSPLPDVKLRVVTQLPAALHPGIGMAVDKANGVYALRLAFETIQQIPGITPDKYATTRQLYWDSVADDYVTIPYTLPTAKVVSQSSTSATVGLGEKNFVVDPGLGWAAGTRVRGTDNDNQTNFVEGIVKAYDPVTGAVTIVVDETQGSGTISNWSLGIAAQSQAQAIYDTRSSAIGSVTKTSINYIRTNGYATAGDSGGADYYRKASGDPDQPGDFTDGGGARWGIASRTVSPKMFGAKGDNATDDQAALADALIFGAPIVDGQGFTYYVKDVGGLVSAIQSNTTLRNMTLNSPDNANWSYVLSATGSEGASVTAASGMAKGTFSISVTNAATLSVGIWVRVETDELWGNEPSAHEKRGEIKRIASIVSTTVTFDDSAYDSYAYAGGANNLRLTPLTMLENIKLDNVEFNGGGDGSNQYLALFEYVHGLTFTNVTASKVPVWMFDVRGCLDVTVNGCKLHDADSDQLMGLNYGFVFSECCQDVTVSGSHFDHFRHGVTFGGTRGVSRRLVVGNSTFRRMIEAGIDTHPATDGVTITGNAISIMGGNSERDGIMMQGANHTCTGNEIDGVTGTGIAAQMMANAYSDKLTISGNIIHSNQANVIGILVENYKSTAPCHGVSIGPNIVHLNGAGSRAIIVQSVQGTGVWRRVSITGGGYESESTAMTLQATTGQIAAIAISGACFKNNDTVSSNCISISGANVGRGTFMANVVEGGYKGLSIGSGTFVGGTTSANSISGYGAGGAT